MENYSNLLPMVPLRGLVIFPSMVANFEAIRDFSVSALEQAMKADRSVFLVMQKDMSNNTIDRNNLYEIGVIAKIRYILRLQKGLVRVMVEGIRRARLVNIEFNGNYYISEVTDYGTGIEDSQKADAYMRSIIEAIDDYAAVSDRINPDFAFSIRNIKSLDRMIDTCAVNIIDIIDQKQEILGTESLEERAEKMIRFIDTETQIFMIEKDINMRTRQQIDKYQREAYLREQLKSIQDELSGGEMSEIDEYRKKVEALPLSEGDMEKLNRELDKMASMSSSSPDYNVSRSYIDYIVSLPYGKYTTDNLDIVNAEEVLDRDHFGLEKVKERILEFLSVRALNKGKQGSIICFAGPPGVGKTSISRSIADALGRKFVRMSLGGVHDEAEIRGHRRTYIGAMAGRIIAGIKEAGTMNPVFLLDEIDKMANDFRGDPASAMLEVLDPTTNTAFNDHYLDIAFDLSDVIFLTTANDINSIPRPLYDRMEIIDISGYTSYEKFEIAKRHIIPKQIKLNGLSSRILRIEDSAISSVISGYTYESGVRELERNIEKICRIAAKEVIRDNRKRITVKEKNIEKYLGKQKFRDTSLPKEDTVGVVCGLAWTSGGGAVMPVEAIVLSGGGSLELTGQLGDVMKESAKIGVSLLRSCASKYGIDEGFAKNNDIHLHVPEGAVPKDGPSAGITMCLSMLSALTGRKVRHDVAMTGELTLTGRVLPIGGLKEKSLAALRAGIHTIIIPKDNVIDLDEIPDEVKDQIRFIPVSAFDEVVRKALEKT